MRKKNGVLIAAAALVLAAMLAITLHLTQAGSSTAQSKDPVAAAPPALKWGDMAPPLKVAKWLKGTPVEKFEPGKVYVVEFWATWCGPCKAAMPHLSNLAKKYEGRINFIGVDVWEEAENPLPEVQKFVDQQGDNMAYNVAADEPGREGFMAVNWLGAANKEMVPATFVVSDGKLVWIGHPNNVDTVLPKILDKSYDLAATLAASQAEDATNAGIKDIMHAANEKIAAKDYPAALKLLDTDAARALPQRQQIFWADRVRFGALLHIDEKRALEYANELYGQQYGDVRRRQFGEIIAETGANEGVNLSKETYAFGAESLEKAGVAGPGWTTGHPFHEFKAICYAGAGEPAKAVAAMRKALEIATSPYTPAKPEVVQRLDARLVKYKELAGDTSIEPPHIVRTKPGPIYDETADAKQQIAKALAAAKKSNHRVLIQWGGNWCVWCLRLHELMSSDKAIARALASNYDVVHIDTGRPEGKNVELAQSYGAELKENGFPYLTILDADGKVLANQGTSALEIGGVEAGHDPAKLLTLLGTHAVTPQEAATIASDAAAAAEKNPQSKQAIGQPFELSFTDAISGRKIDVQKDLKGKVVVVDFWATWCGLCVAEMPKNKELYAKYKDKGVEFIGVSLDHTEAEDGLKQLKDYVAENGIGWPQYYQGNYVYSEFSLNWGVTSLPTVFVIDADGKLISKQAQGQLERLIPKLLEGREGNASAR